MGFQCQKSPRRVRECSESVMKWGGGPEHVVNDSVKQRPTPGREVAFLLGSDSRGPPECKISQLCCRGVRCRRMFERTRVCDSGRTRKAFGKAP